MLRRFRLISPMQKECSSIEYLLCGGPGVQDRYIARRGAPLTVMGSPVIRAVGGSKDGEEDAWQRR